MASRCAGARPGPRAATGSNRSATPGRGVRPPQLRLLVLGFFTCGFQLAFITVHLPAYLVDRGSRPGRRLDAGLHRSVQHHRLARLGWLPTACRSATLLSMIYFARAWRSWLHHAADSPADDRVRRRDGPDVALHRAAHLGTGRADVRHALVGDAVRLRLLQPPGRRFPRRLARRRRCSSGPAPTTPSGGSRSCSACCRR